MAHTPTTPATDDRPIKILERAEVPDAHKQVLFDVVRHVQSLAENLGEAEKLQCEFGREAVAMIHDCNQFVRLHRAGDAVGRVELLLEPHALDSLCEAGFEAGEAQGFIFQRFGWKSFDPVAGDKQALLDAVEAAYAKARGAAPPAAL